MTPEHKVLAKRFVEYISDDLPPEIEMPTMLDMGNALLDAHAEIEAQQMVISRAMQRLNESGTGEMGLTDTIHAVHEILRGSHG